MFGFVRNPQKARCCFCWHPLVEHLKRCLLEMFCCLCDRLWWCEERNHIAWPIRISGMFSFMVEDIVAGDFWTWTDEVIVASYLGIIARYKGPEFPIGWGRRASHSSKIRTGSLSPPSGRPHLLLRTSGFVSQSPLLGFVGIFFKLNNFATIYHLQNGEILNVRVVMVLAASETQVLCQILKVDVCKGNAILTSKFSFTPE